MVSFSVYLYGEQKAQRMYGKALMAITVSFLIFLGDAYAQKGTGGNLKAKAAIGVGFNHPIGRPIEFPIGYTDAAINPLAQTPELGYQLSCSVLRRLYGQLWGGATVHVSQYSFIESGDELSFWANQIRPYSIKRSFDMYGLGATLGFVLIDNKVDNLTAFATVNYEAFLSTENIFLWTEAHNNHKFTSSFALEYAHALSEQWFLSFGPYMGLGLNDFYKTIAYRPVRYGIALGIERIW